MPTAKVKSEALIAMFEAMAAVIPPPESSQMLVRHLQCKESLTISGSIVEAIDRYAGNELQLLAVPTELLPPLA